MEYCHEILLEPNILLERIGNIHICRKDKKESRSRTNSCDWNENNRIAFLPCTRRCIKSEVCAKWIFFKVQSNSSVIYDSLRIDAALTRGKGVKNE